MPACPSEGQTSHMAALTNYMRQFQISQQDGAGVAPRPRPRHSVQCMPLLVLPFLHAFYISPVLPGFSLKKKKNHSPISPCLRLCSRSQPQIPVARAMLLLTQKGPRDTEPKTPCAEQLFGKMTWCFYKEGFFRQVYWFIDASISSRLS